MKDDGLAQVLSALIGSLTSISLAFIMRRDSRKKERKRRRARRHDDDPYETEE